VSLDDPVLAAASPGEFEAQAKAALLGAEGIEAMVTPGPPESRVWVRRGDLDRARALLRERLGDAAEIDWDATDVGRRVDDLPLRRPGRRPFLFWVGWALAAAIIVFGVVATIVAVFV
jgi:hypothetical protein